MKRRVWQKLGHGCLVLVRGGAVALMVWVMSRGYGKWLKESETFHIRRTEIQGADLLSEKEVLRLGGVEPRSFIWEVDLRKAEDEIAGHPFVETVRVERVLPDVLRIRLEEKRPLALLNFGGQLFCVDGEGMVLPSQPGKLYDLPVLSGAFQGAVTVGRSVRGEVVREGLNFLVRVLEDRPTLYGQISEVVVRESEGLIVYTSRAGVPVWIGREGYAWKVRYLEAILEELVREGTLSRVRYIDLRCEGQVIVGKRV